MEGQQQEKYRYEREYLGTTITAQNYKEIRDKKDGRQQINFHNKHLRAYLRGYDRFTFGVDNDGDPIFHKVQQQIKKIKIEL